MVSPLLALPLDLLLMIIDILPTHTLFAFSRTCHTLQALLTPLLVAHCATRADTILRWAVENKRPDLLKCAMAEGASMPSGPDGAYLLGKAVDQGYVDIVRLLLAHGADPNKGFGHTPPLVSAVCGGDVPIARILLEAGADARTALQRFSVELALRRKHWAMASLLYELEYGSYLSEIISKLR